jgi:hypothetical protein
VHTFTDLSRVAVADLPVESRRRNPLLLTAHCGDLLSITRLDWNSIERLLTSDP